MTTESIPSASQASASTDTTAALTGLAPSGMKGWATLAAAVSATLPADLSATNRVLDSAMRLLSGRAG